MPSSLAADIRSFVIANYLLGRDEGFDDNASFMVEGMIDSTGILQLVSHLEETYNIEVADEELTPDNLDSVNRVVSYLTNKLTAPVEPKFAEASSSAEMLGQVV